MDDEGMDRPVKLGKKNVALRVGQGLDFSFVAFQVCQCQMQRCWARISQVDSSVLCDALEELTGASEFERG